MNEMKIKLCASLTTEKKKKTGISITKLVNRSNYEQMKKTRQNKTMLETKFKP